MHGGAQPAVRKLAEGAVLTEQGERGDDIYLLLDGVLSIWVDGIQAGELGPGAVVGERAAPEDGRRTATLRAVTGCVIAAVARTRSTATAWPGSPNRTTGKPRTAERRRGHGLAHNRSSCVQWPCPAQRAGMSHARHGRAAVARHQNLPSAPEAFPEQISTRYVAYRPPQMAAACSPAGHGIV